MGKTAMCERFLRNAQERDEVLVLRGRCYERETMPYKAADGLVEGLVAANVDEVGPEHLTVIVSDEGVVAVVLVDAEVGVEAVGDRVPGHPPAHPFPERRDLGLRSAGGEHEGGVTRVEVGEVSHLVGDQ